MMETLQPKLRFSDFNKDWVKGRFEDFVKVNQGLAILKNNRFSEGGKNRLNYITIPYLEGKVYEYIENPQESVICNKEDIIITRTGSGLGQTWTNNHGVFHNNFFKVTPLKEDLDKRFLFFYLNTATVQNTMKKFAGVGAIPDLNHSDFYNIEFYKPSFLEQQKISTFLTAVEKKIELLQKKEQCLKQYKNGITQKIFNQEIRFKDKNERDFPDWEVKSLGELGKTYNGLTGKAKENFGNGKPYIQYKQIFSNSKIDISKFEYVEVGENENQNKVIFGDVFFTVSSETPNEIGTASVLLDEIDELYLNSFCFGYRANSLKILNPYFSRYLFRNELFRNDIIKLAQGSTRYNMSKVELLKLKVYLPNLEEQIEIANFLSAIDEKIDQVSEQLKQTTQYKKGLLQQMFI